jgi:hypothetical protein
VLSSQKLDNLELENDRLLTTAMLKNTRREEEEKIKVGHIVFLFILHSMDISALHKNIKRQDQSPCLAVSGRSKYTATGGNQSVGLFQFPVL